MVQQLTRAQVVRFSKRGLRPPRPSPKKSSDVRSGVATSQAVRLGPSPSAEASVVPAAPLASAQQALINQDRVAAGLLPLNWSACLATVALQNARRMAVQGHISHANGPSLDQKCHLGLSAAENVGYSSVGTDDVVLNAMFMRSEEHRANILGPYHSVGAAWMLGANGYGYLAVEFS